MPAGKGWAHRPAGGVIGDDIYSDALDRLQVRTAAATYAFPREGDLAVLSIGHLATDWTTGPDGSGWHTLLRAQNGPALRLEIYWRRVTAVPEPTFYNVLGVTAGAGGQIDYYPGPSLSDDDLVEAVVWQANPAGTRLMTPSIDATGEDGLLLFFNVSDHDGDYQQNRTKFAADPVNDPQMRPPDESINDMIHWWNVFGGSSGTEDAAVVHWGYVIKATPGPTGIPYYQTVLAGNTIAAMVLLRPHRGPLTPGTRYYGTQRHPGTPIMGPRQGAWTGSMRGPGNQPLDQLWLLSQMKTANGTRGITAMRVNRSGEFMWWRWLTRPLLAQTLGGTFRGDLYVQYVPGSGAPVTTMQLRVHLYVTVGQSTAARHTLLDQHVDAQVWPVNGTGAAAWLTLAPLALPTVAIELGDSLMLELGTHIVSQPYVVPTATVNAQQGWDPFQANRSINTILNVDRDDGHHADSYAFPSWVEFSGTISEAPPAPPPPHTACAAGRVIPALPYADGPLDTTTAPSNQRQVWYRWTCDTPGRVFAHTFGTNYRVEIQVFEACGALNETPDRVNYQVTQDQQDDTTSLSSVVLDARLGVTYHFRLRAKGDSYNAPSGGGSLRFALRRVIPLAIGDLVVGLGGYTLRYTASGDLADLNGNHVGWFSRGLAIDYTKRPILDYEEETHTQFRLLVGNDYDVAIHDLADLRELDWISGPYTYDQSELCGLALSADGTRLYAGYFGDTFNWKVGGWGYLSGPAVGDAAAVTVVNPVDGDNTNLNPPEAVLQHVPYEAGGSNWLALNAAGTELLYTSNGLQVPIGGQRILRWDLAAEAPLPDFATVPVGPGPLPGVKGLCVLATGGLLVCNGGEVVRYDSGGAITHRYTPPAQPYGQSLVDVKVDPAGLTCWVLEQEADVLYHFDLATGDLLHTVETRLGANNGTGLVIYAPPGEEPPPDPDPPVIITDDWPKLPTEGCMDASTFVVNMALAEIGITQTIGSLDSDVSQEATTARLLFTDVLETVLRDFPWKFATEYAALVLVGGSPEAPVNADWTYSFLAPDDCVRVRRVCDPVQQRRYTTTPIPFDQRAEMPNGLRDLVLCNEPGGGQLPPPPAGEPPSITIEYTRRMACAAQVNDAQFREALVFKLAARMAKALARDSKDADRCLRNYMLALPKAQTQHANDGEPQRPTSDVPDWLKGR